MTDGRSKTWTIVFLMANRILAPLQGFGLWLTVRAQDVDSRLAFKSLGLKNRPEFRPISDYIVKVRNV